MQTIKNNTEFKAVTLGLMHSTVFPIVGFILFSWYGLFYLFIPVTMYLTLKKDGIGRDWFFISLFIYGVFFAAGLVDYSTTVGGY